MNAHTESEIIAEITATTVKTIQQTVRESSKRTRTENFFEKTTDEGVKRIKSSTVPEFKSKGNKIRYEANNSIMEKIDKVISAIEKGKIERCQEKLAEVKKIIFKQQKLLKIADREEDGWKVIKCYLSDDFASDAEDEKQLSRARRGAAANKRKRTQISKKIKRSSFGTSPPPLRKNSKISNKLHQEYSGIRNNPKPQKVYFACRQEGHFQYFYSNKRN